MSLFPHVRQTPVYLLVLMAAFAGAMALAELFGVPACVTSLPDGMPLVTLGTPPGGPRTGRG